eukprot:11196215-Lingulodinium_polyedra.AAC.1
MAIVWACLRVAASQFAKRVMFAWGVRLALAMGSSPPRVAVFLFKRHPARRWCWRVFCPCAHLDAR